MAVAQVARLADGVAVEQVHGGPGPLANNLERRLMNQVGMVTVDRVLDLELPVARVAVLVDAGAHVEFAFGRQVDEQVDLIFGGG